MNNLNKKQKIIAGIIASIVVAGIYYYAYAKDSKLLTEEELEVEQSQVNNIGNQNQNTGNETNNDTGIIVHVSGAVNQEGIIELKANSRIADAIEKAGGITADACMDEINLAYVLEDGIKIHIPTKEEQEKNNANKQEQNNSNKQEQNNTKKQEQNYISQSSGTSAESKRTSSQNTKININTAKQTDLETLPGIGPSTALKIITYRDENGKFKTIEEIKEVNGIGDSKFNNIKDLITI